MQYRIKAHPTTYAGVNFRSRLEARWAAFFNYMQWKWSYEPIDLAGWSPDFRIQFGGEEFLAEVKPYTRIDEFRSHPCWDRGGMCLGIDPTVTCRKRPGYAQTLEDFYRYEELQAAWIAAGNLVQWKKKKNLTEEEKWNTLFKGKKQIISGVVKRSLEPKKVESWDALLRKGL